MLGVVLLLVSFSAFERMKRIVESITLRITQGD
jgi:hypothetical protein